VKYNVLMEGWIPILDLDGNRKEVGILDALENAHKYRSVVASSPTVTYGIYRLLINFLMDIHRPETRSEITELFKQGSFDIEAIKRYYENCNALGERFDLFDEKYPFLQQAEFYKPEQVKEGKGSFIKEDPMAKLAVDIPVGNNHLHFNHAIESSHVFTSKECIQILCTIPCFFLRYDKGSYFGITGQPPVFFLAGGENLFETLALSMFTKAQYSEFEWGLPLWRQEKQKENLYPITIMDGLYSPSKQIQLLAEENESGMVEVKRVKYAEGVFYKSLFEGQKTFLWKDPHACYFFYKNEEKAFKPKENRSVWRDLGTIFDGTNKPAIFHQIEQTLGRRSGKKVQVFSFSLVTELKGTVFMPITWFSEEIPLLLDIILEKDALATLQRVLITVDDLTRDFRRVLGKTSKNLSGKKDESVCEFIQLADGVIQQFLYEVRLYIFRDLCQRLLEETSDEVINPEIYVALRRITLKVFDSNLETLGTSARTLKWITLARNDFSRNVYGTLKRGGFTHDEGTSK
jgi:CRISPR type I-E/ECOLI-associated protein CasA/Cse1